MPRHQAAPTVFARKGLKKFVALVVLCAQLSTPLYSAAAYGPRDCERLLGKVGKSFDLNLFSQLKEGFRRAFQEGESVDQNALKGPEATLAFIEATSEKNGYDIMNISRMLETGTKKEKKAILRSLGKLDLKKGITPTQAQDFITDLYFYSKYSLNDTPDFILRRLPKMPRERAQERIESELAATDIVSAAQNLGLVRDGGLLEKMRAWQRENPNIHATIVTLAVNIPSMIYLGVPVHLPNYEWVRGKAIPKEILEKGRTHGFEAMREDVAKLWKYPARFDFWWSVARKSYQKGAQLYLVSMLMAVAPLLIYFLRASRVTKDELAKLQEATFDPEKIRQEQFENWKEAFEEFNGRNPDPATHPEDREEWDRVWNGLKNIPDNDLKVQF